jgi:putative transposase
MAERGFEVEHSSVHRWVIKLVRLFEMAFRRHNRPVGKSWRMNATYVKVRGRGSTCVAQLIRPVRRLIFYCRRFATKLSSRAIDRNGVPETVGWIKAKPIRRAGGPSTRNGKGPSRSGRSSI